MIPRRNLRRFFFKTIKQPIYAFAVFKKRLKGYLYYLFARGRSSYPEAITLFLTHRCNLRCRMCGQWGESGVTKKESRLYIKEELSSEELKGIIDDLVKFRPNITLFGGEPLLHPDCIGIIRYIKENGMHCLMITNGSLLNNLAKEIVDSGLDELNVSLDGSRGLHDVIRGMAGLFDEIINGIKEINYFKLKERKRKPLINLQCTINKDNYRHLEQLIDVADEVRADSLTFHNLIFLDRKVLDEQREYDNLLGCASSDWEGFVFEPDIEPQVLYEKIWRISSGKYRFSVDLFPNFSPKALMEYYQNSAYLPSGYPARCLSPWMVAYIFPDGEVRPCLNFSYSYGNIKENKFTEIWNGFQAQAYRRTLKQKQIFPVCARCTELYRY